MTSGFLGLAATAAALFVVVLLVTSFVMPLMASVSASIQGIAR